MVLESPIASWTRGASKTPICAVTRADGVVPFAMEVVTGDIEGGHLSVGHGDTLGIGFGSSSQCTVRPVLVVVALIRSTMTR